MVCFVMKPSILTENSKFSRKKSNECRFLPLAGEESYPSVRIHVCGNMYFCACVYFYVNGYASQNELQRLGGLCSIA
jgi:hypothetical protein